MADLSLGLDPLQPRFSTNFLDDLDVSKENGSSTVPEAAPQPSSPVPTNPFRSESPTASDQGVELDHTAPEFDFAAHLETADSVSSLDQVGLSGSETASPAHQAGVNGVSTDPGDQNEPPSKTPPTLVARTSEHWETFDENGVKIDKPHPPTANGGHSGGQDKESEGEKKGKQDGGIVMGVGKMPF